MKLSEIAWPCRFWELWFMGMSVVLVFLLARRRSHYTEMSVREVLFWLIFASVICGIPLAQLVAH
jgi:hypothetical protein